MIAPYLFLAPLLQMLFQVAANQFLVIKRTWPNMFILFIGAIVNIVINYFLIPIMGIEGASLATLFGYVVSDIICVIVLCKMKLMVLEKRFIISVIIMISYLAIWRIFIKNNYILGTVLAIIISIVFAFYYKKEILKIVNMLRKEKK